MMLLGSELYQSPPLIFSYADILPQVDLTESDMPLVEILVRRCTDTVRAT